MESMVEAIQQMVKGADESGRKKLIDTLSNLILSIEGPQDVMMRVLLYLSYISITRVGCDLQLFRHLKDCSEPASSDFLAQSVQGEPALVARLLRYLASVGSVEETEPEKYVANQRTKTIAEPEWQSSICYAFDVIWPSFFALPEFLKETDYKDVTSSVHCPFNRAFETDLSIFEWLPKRPHLHSNFNNYMSIQRYGMPTWLDKYPFKDKAQDMDPNQVFFVDIGGGLGHQSLALRNALPKTITNRIIVQDLPELMEQVTKRLDIEYTAHNFWEIQPVKGARIYYMRNIIHDWPSDKAFEILQNIKPAMDNGSVLLIDEMVLPDIGVHWQATELDMAMMALLGSRERTRAQWNELITQAGLKIHHIYQYTTSLNDSIIECILPDDSEEII